MGIGFAVPSDLARRVMADLVKYGYVVRGYPGVQSQDLTPELAREFDVHGAAGALVSGVTPGGPAHTAGLQVGDVVTRFDGQQVRDTRQLRLCVAEARPCQTVPVEVIRNGSSAPLRVILGQQPQEEPSTPEQSAEQQDAGALQGVTIIELSSQIRQYLKIPPDVQGAVVLDLHAWSAAALAGLRPGDVIQSINREEVTRTEQVPGLIHTATQKGTLLRVWSNAAGSHFMVVRHTS